MIANAAENVVSITSEQETDSPAVSSEDECSAGEEVDDVDAKDYFTDKISVNGSFWEGRCQESLIKCVEPRENEVREHIPVPYDNLFQSILSFSQLFLV